MRSFIHTVRSSIALLLVMTVLLGVVYPLVVLAFGQAFFAHRATGSLIQRGDEVLGSSLLGQEFTSPKYFWGRLSATTPPYNASASAGSNLSPANPKVLDAANVRIAALQKADPGNKALIPVELVTASASGLDPHISLDAARYQITRVAKARGAKPESIEELLQKYVETPGFGFLGDPYINVLRVNIALDEATDFDAPRRDKSK